jgi:hypothetical protein
MMKKLLLPWFRWPGLYRGRRDIVVLACRCPASIIRARISSSRSWRKRGPQRRGAKLARRDSRRASDARATRPDAPELTQTGGF